MVESTRAAGPASSIGGVQSVHRSLDVIEAVAANQGPITIAEIATMTRLPLGTTHRLLQTLISRGYMRQLADRRYTLGSRFVPLGAEASRLHLTEAVGELTTVVAAVGESANIAVRSGDMVEYIAHVPSTRSMRMFTEVGRRAEMHCTGVGKAMLAALSDEEVLTIVRRVGLKTPTVHTHATSESLLEDLRRIRERGYATDDEEQELGVRCVAIAVPHDGLTWSAVSISGPTARMTDEVIQRAVPLLEKVAQRLAVSH